MAPIQEPEIQLAQRLASNEKAIRTKAMKKLRKYISARSQRAAGRLTERGRGRTRSQTQADLHTGPRSHHTADSQEMNSSS
ncbi:hypothetical protein XENOCAPTIV_013677, partial [Xenoophorus captivus]